MRSWNRKHVVVAIVAAVSSLVLACSSDEKIGGGGGCSTTEDCESGLECLNYAVTTTGCTTAGPHCTKPCDDTTDCGAVRRGFTCRADCDGKLSCQ